MLTTVLRWLLARSTHPFEFICDNSSPFDFSSPNLGIYIHVPFCTTLCPFCPYYKEKYAPHLAEVYIDGLLKEINLRKPEAKLPIAGLYAGGGSPALLIDKFPAVFAELGKHYEIVGSQGIELHPDNVSPVVLYKIKKAGFNMVSVGIQSFQQHLLENLGRGYQDFTQKLIMIQQVGFQAVDIDLIFGIPEQTEQDLRNDFSIAAEHGATQISTYPFIDFSYAHNRKKPLTAAAKKRLLAALVDVSARHGYERTSIWTFAIPGTPQYSSVTRDNFIGFGPSAASLSSQQFTINTFSVAEYSARLAKQQPATALTLNFTQRTRMLYWLFWNLYNLKLNSGAFKHLFGTSLTKHFGLELKVASLAGVVAETKDGFCLTEKGAYFFHCLEQHYTHQYIDKTWRTCTFTPWPEKIQLL